MGGRVESPHPIYLATVKQIGYNKLSSITEMQWEDKRQQVNNLFNYIFACFYWETVVSPHNILFGDSTFSGCNLGRTAHAQG